MDERSTPRGGAHRIGEILLAADLLTREQLREALAIQRRQGGRLGHILVDRNFVDQEDFAEALAAQLNLPYISLEGYVFDPKVAGFLPRGTLEHHRVIPLQVVSTRVTMAMADPFNELAVKELERASGLAVKQVIATSADILGSVARVHQDLKQREGLLDSLRKLRDRDKLEEIAASEAV